MFLLFSEPGLDVVFHIVSTYHLLDSGCYHPRFGEDFGREPTPRPNDETGKVRRRGDPRRRSLRPRKRTPLSWVTRVCTGESEGAWSGVSSKLMV